MPIQDRVLGSFNKLALRVDVSKSTFNRWDVPLCILGMLIDLVHQEGLNDFEVGELLASIILKCEYLRGDLFSRTALHDKSRDMGRMYCKAPPLEFGILALF